MTKKTSMRGPDLAECMFFITVVRRQAQLAAMVQRDQVLAQAEHPDQPPTAVPIPTSQPYNYNETPVTCNAEPIACEISTLTPCGEVRPSNVCLKMDPSAFTTPSKKSLRSRKSSPILNRQSVVVVKS